jgi:hypothetical protein
MMLVLRLILAVLATYRLAVMLTDEDGPLFLLARLREFTDNRRVIEQQKRERGPWASLDDGLRCAWCAGVWAAALCSVLVWWPTLAGDVTLTWLGLAGGALFLERIHDEQL